MQLPSSQLVEDRAAFSGPFCACMCFDVAASFAFIAWSVRQASIFATSSSSVQS